MKEYTIKAIDLAKRFNVTHKTVMNLFHSGKLKGVRFASAIRFNEEDVQAYLQGQNSNLGQEKRA